MEQKDLDKLKSLVKDIKIAMMVTRDNEQLRSRPMATHEIEQNGSIWFFTEKNSSLLSEIEVSRYVNISYSDTSSNTYVSVSGSAEIIEDKNKINELWNASLKAWFPKGKDDPNISLLRINIGQAEYWDMPNSKMVQLIGMVKAAVAGTTYQPGENKKIS